MIDFIEIILSSPVFGYYVAISLAALLVVSYCSFFSGNIAVIGFLLYSMKPIIDLAYNFRVGGVNLQSVSIVILLFLMLIYTLVVEGFPQGKTYKLATCTLMAYAIWVSLVTIRNGISDQTVEDLLKTVLILPVFLVGHTFFYEPKKRNRNMRQYVYILSAVTVLGYLQLFGIIPYSYHAYVGGSMVDRVSCGYLSPRNYMNFVIVGFVFILYLNRMEQDSLKKIFINGLFISWLPIIYFTYLRSAYVALILMYLIYLLLVKKMSRFCMVVLCSCLFFVGFYDQVSALFFDTIVALQSGSYGDLAHGRVRLWSQIISYLNATPVKWVTGYGVTPIVGNVMVNDPHNDVIKIVFETGLVGFLMFAAFIFISMSAFVKRIRLSNELSERFLGTVSFVLYIGIAVYGLSVRPSDYPAIVLFAVSLSSYCCWSNDRESLREVVGYD